MKKLRFVLSIVVLFGFSAPAFAQSELILTKRQEADQEYWAASSIALFTGFAIGVGVFAVWFGISQSLVSEKEDAVRQLLSTPTNNPGYALWVEQQSVHIITMRDMTFASLIGFTAASLGTGIAAIVLNVRHRNYICRRYPERCGKRAQPPPPRRKSSVLFSE